LRDSYLYDESPLNFEQVIKMKRKVINRRCFCDLELDFLDSFPKIENYEVKV
jgi:hypothetical protein